MSLRTVSSCCQWILSLIKLHQCGRRRRGRELRMNEAKIKTIESMDWKQNGLWRNEISEMEVHSRCIASVHEEKESRKHGCMGEMQQQQPRCDSAIKSASIFHKYQSWVTVANKLSELRHDGESQYWQQCWDISHDWMCFSGINKQRLKLSDALVVGTSIGSEPLLRHFYVGLLSM